MTRPLLLAVTDDGQLLAGFPKAWRRAGPVDRGRIGLASVWHDKAVAHTWLGHQQLGHGCVVQLAA